MMKEEDMLYVKRNGPQRFWYRHTIHGRAVVPIMKPQNIIGNVIKAVVDPFILNRLKHLHPTSSTKYFITANNNTYPPIIGSDTVISANAKRADIPHAIIRI